MENVKKYELSLFEKFFMEANFTGDALTMATSFADTGNIDDLDTIKTKSLEALKYLQRRHPFLRGYVGIENENASIVVTNDASDKIDLEIVDLTKESPTRADLIERCTLFNSTQYDFTEKLIWRAQLIFYKEDAKNKIVFNLVIPSFATDGFSITTLSVEFANILNALLTNKTCKEMSDTVEPCDNVHEHFLKSGIYNEEHSKLAKEIQSKRVDFKLDPIFHSPEERGFYLDLFKIDKSTSEIIMSKSKKLGVRLTAYFYNIAFYTFKKLYDENKIELPKRFTLDFPINLRMRLQPNVPFSTPRIFITFVTPATEEKHYGQFTDFWNDSKYIQTLVEESSDMKTGAALAFLYRSIDPSYSETEESSVDFCLSNLGAFVNNSAELFPGPIDIEEMYCSDSLKYYPDAFFSAQVHVYFWKGQLMLQFGANKAYFVPFFARDLSNCSNKQSKRV